MDEFSDFQMAVQKPPPALNMVSLTPSYPAVNGGPAGKKTPGGQRFSDSSPVHSFTGHSKSDFIHSSQQPVTTTSKVSPSPLKPLVPPPTSSQKSGKSVGSRLANYDLGLSVPVPPQSNGFQGCSMELSSLNPPKTIKDQPTLRTQQDLLIGEEDRYSALRMLIETDINSTVSVFETSVSSADSQPPSQPPPETEEPRPPPNPGFYNMNPPSFPNAYPVTNNSCPVVNNSNSSSALEFSMTTPADSPSTGGDSSSDFGDFQSFTGFAFAPAPTPVEVNNQRPEQQASFSGNSNLQIASPHHSHSSHSVIFSIMGNFQSGLQQRQPPHSVSFKEPPKLDFLTMGGDNEGCESDEDFGDFVSVEPVVSKSQNVPVPPPPDISTLPQETSVPEINCWNNHLDLSSLTNTASAVEDKHETFRKSQHQPQQPAPQCKQQSIGIDDFDVFSGFSGVTNNTSNSPDEGHNGVDWLDKTQDTSIALPRTTEEQLQNLNQVNPQPVTSAPSFIRTSLIRNDEVTDVDPVKWNQSVEDGNNDSAIDYNSFERKDFSSNGKSKFLDVSPETRSIASLDLGNYVTVDYGDAGGVNINNNNISNTSKVFMDQPMIMQQNVHGKTESPVTPPTPNRHEAMGTEESVSYDEYDKYQCFRDECETEKERYANEWNRCLQACKLMVSDAFRVFNGVSTSEVIREVVADEKGFFYVLNITEIYRVSQRIQKSAERIGVESRLGRLTLEINNLWETLSAFLLGTCVSNEICQASEDFDFNEPQEPFPSCGVCLCRVVTSETSHFLDYGGKFYHCQCANFWVNQVDPILPSLSYVSNANSSDNSSSSGDNGTHQQKIMKLSSLA